MTHSSGRRSSTAGWSRARDGATSNDLGVGSGSVESREVNEVPSLEHSTPGRARPSSIKHSRERPTDGGSGRRRGFLNIDDGDGGGSRPGASHPHQLHAWYARGPVAENA